MPPDLLSRALKRCGCLFCFALVQKLYVYFTTAAAATSQMPRPNDYYLEGKGSHFASWTAVLRFVKLASRLQAERLHQGLKIVPMLPAVQEVVEQVW